MVTKKINKEDFEEIVERAIQKQLDKRLGKVEKDKWRIHNKLSIDSNIEELRIKREFAVVAKYVGLAAVGIIIGIAAGMSIFGDIYLKAAAVLMVFMDFIFLLVVIDLMNDVGRIDMWIYLKEKLGDIDE